MLARGRCPPAPLLDESLETIRQQLARRVPDRLEIVPLRGPLGADFPGWAAALTSATARSLVARGRTHRCRYRGTDRAQHARLARRRRSVAARGPARVSARSGRLRCAGRRRALVRAGGWHCSTRLFAQWHAVAPTRCCRRWATTSARPCCSTASGSLPGSPPWCCCRMCPRASGSRRPLSVASLRRPAWRSRPRCRPNSPLPAAALWRVDARRCHSAV